jgi:hypothetical protein
MEVTGETPALPGGMCLCGKFIHSPFTIRA